MKDPLPTEEASHTNEPVYQLENLEHSQSLLLLFLFCCSRQGLM